jgi:hypothetical protein
MAGATCGSTPASAWSACAGSSTGTGSADSGNAGGRPAASTASNDTIRADGMSATATGAGVATGAIGDWFAEGILNRDPHRGQMPLRPARWSLTFTRWPFGQKETIPIVRLASRLGDVGAPES